MDRSGDCFYTHTHSQRNTNTRVTEKTNYAEAQWEFSFFSFFFFERLIFSFFSQTIMLSEGGNSREEGALKRVRDRESERH